jgi:hypothetical protein
MRDLVEIAQALSRFPIDGATPARDLFRIPIHNAVKLRRGWGTRHLKRGT